MRQLACYHFSLDSDQESVLSKLIMHTYFDLCQVADCFGHPQNILESCNGFVSLQETLSLIEIAFEILLHFNFLIFHYS